MSPTSRLHRLFPVANASLFAFYTPVLSKYDGDITEVVIHRGGSDVFRYTPSSIEISFSGVTAPTVNGNLCRFFIRDAPMSALTSATGAPAAAAARFAGRVSTVDIRDTGRAKVARGRQHTTLAGSSWAAQMNYSRKVTKPVATWTVKRVIQEALGMLDQSTPRGITAELFGVFDSITQTETDPIRWTDALGKYVEELGFIARETRDGRTQFFTLTYLDGLARSRAAKSVPIGRHQALSPAQWEMHNERPAARHQYSITNANGAVVQRYAELTTGDMGEIREIVEHDWSYMNGDESPQAYRHAYALAFQSSTRYLKVPSITIDLSSLMASRIGYDRALLGYLLSLETYDPIGFTTDWHPYIQGWQIVTGITESITPDSWTMELEMCPWEQVMGVASPATPDALTWDQHTSPWSAYSKNWS